MRLAVRQFVELYQLFRGELEAEIEFCGQTHGTPSGESDGDGETDVSEACHGEESRAE